MRQFKLWILACVLGSATLLSSQTAQAATNKFCVVMNYHYFDSNQGEDRLKQTVWNGIMLFGSAALERHWLHVFRWDGSQWVTLFAGWTDSNGCSPSFELPIGTYISPYLKSAVKLGAGWADVRPKKTDGDYWKVWSSFQISQSGTSIFAAFEDPFAVSLALGQAEEAGATAMGNFCNQSNRGSERDWLGFLYSVNATANDTSDMSELSAIFQSACGGGKCTESDALTWAQVNSAAQSLSTAAEFTKFSNAAVAYGVNK